MPGTEFARFAMALQDGTLDVPADLLPPRSGALEERFAIHRSNVYAGLVELLAERHPVTRALVGEEFFDGMALQYVLREPPRRAALHAYGDSLPRFIASFAPAAQLPWLAEVARIEAAWHRAWCAADDPVLALHDLAALTATELAAARFTPHAATSLLRSDFPAGTLWHLHQQSAPDLSGLDWQPEAVLVTRPEARIQVHILAAPVADFAASLLAGRTVAQAAATREAHEESSAGAALAILVDAGAFTEIRS